MESRALIISNLQVCMVTADRFRKSAVPQGQQNSAYRQHKQVEAFQWTEETKAFFTLASVLVLKWKGMWDKAVP